MEEGWKDRYWDLGGWDGWIGGNGNGNGIVRDGIQKCGYGVDVVAIWRYRCGTEMVRL
jgi:hypothetical protein